jgi:hypothetical protein
VARKYEDGLPTLEDKIRQEVWRVLLDRGRHGAMDVENFKLGAVLYNRAVAIARRATRVAG